MKKVIIYLRVMPGSEELIPLYYNNNGAIAQAKEPRSYQKSKHILRRFHLIREIVTRGNIVVERVPSEDKIIDLLTKPLSHIVFEHHMGLMGIRHKVNLL